MCEIYKCARFYKSFRNYFKMKKLFYNIFIEKFQIRPTSSSKYIILILEYT